MPFRRAFNMRQRLPDCDHVFSALRRQFVMKFAQGLNSRHRATDIDEQQDPIECASPHVECLGGGHDRLSEVVVGHAPRLRAGNVQSLGQMLSEGLAIAG